MKKMIIKCICLKFVRIFHRNHIVLRSGVKHATQAKKIVKIVPPKQNMPLNHKRDEVVSLEKVNKDVGGFNLEHELNKVKIPIPLIEFIKNKAYREVTFKTFKNAVNTISSDEINL